MDRAGHRADVVLRPGLPLGVPHRRGSRGPGGSDRLEPRARPDLRARARPLHGRRVQLLAHPRAGRLPGSPRRDLRRHPRHPRAGGLGAGRAARVRSARTREPAHDGDRRGDPRVARAGPDRRPRPDHPRCERVRRRAARRDIHRDRLDVHRGRGRDRPAGVGRARRQLDGRRHARRAVHPARLRLLGRGPRVVDLGQPARVADRDAAVDGRLLVAAADGRRLRGHPAGPRVRAAGPTRLRAGCRGHSARPCTRLGSQHVATGPAHQWRPADRVVGRVRRTGPRVRTLRDVGRRHPRRQSRRDEHPRGRRDHSRRAAGSAPRDDPEHDRDHRRGAGRPDHAQGPQPRSWTTGSSPSSPQRWPDSGTTPATSCSPCSSPPST